MQSTLVSNWYASAVSVLLVEAYGAKLCSYMLYKSLLMLLYDRCAVAIPVIRR